MSEQDFRGAWRSLRGRAFGAVRRRRVPRLGEGTRRGENRADMQKDPRHPLYRRAEKDEKTADRHVQLRRFLCAQRREKFFTAV